MHCMAYDFAQFKKSVKGVEEWLQKEFSTIRTSRASPSLLDGVFVDAYGTKMPIMQVASMASEDARTLRVAPWDMTQVKAIEKAITVANLGVSVSVDDHGIRVHFPELTGERRAMLAKLAKERLEQARITLRQERDKVWNDIQDKEHAGSIPEDVKFQAKDALQKIMDETNKRLEEMTEKKEKEILS
ncbi:MAG: ribosome recycling factor [Parcubacteria group bacterium Gr01-1014_48]|nr:MAG: ribosome recycling factor [Parcubacteria group bacterium Greene0416_14]TSC73599.1 MAG: ribosome recycling factor [Parcubacteria group bacterium Gr01-1014_48]TSD00973.1 MAG: ribosome recycling factor [Parcubacteria group bacterium Greene1014_15]TSD07537.1 MAG: ribosome recycling factor [Parcubacteria group bacterium Greene0714_4]